MDFEQIEKERKLYLHYYYRRLKISKIVIIISLIGISLTTIISLISLFFHFYYRYTIFMAIFFIMLLFGILAAYRANEFNKIYSNKVKPKLILSILEKYYTNCNFTRDKDVRKDILKSNLLPNDIFIKSEDFISGEFKDISFKMFDTVVYTIEGRRRYVIEPSYDMWKDSELAMGTGLSFRGLWLNFTLDRNFNTKIIIKEPRLFTTTPYPQMQEVQVESIDFTSKYKAFALDKQKFFFIFTPSFIEKFMKLDELCNGRIMFSLIDNVINIGIDNDFDCFELDMFEDSKDNIFVLEEQLSIIAAIINEFNFATDKYNKSLNKGKIVKWNKGKLE